VSGAEAAAELGATEGETEGAIGGAMEEAGVDAGRGVVEAGAGTDACDVGATEGTGAAAGVVTAADVEDGSAGTTGAEGWTPRPSVGSGTSPFTSQTPAVYAGQGGGVLLGT